MGRVHFRLWPFYFFRWDLSAWLPGGESGPTIRFCPSVYEKVWAARLAMKHMFATMAIPGSNKEKLSLWL